MPDGEERGVSPLHLSGCIRDRFDVFCLVFLKVFCVFFAGFLFYWIASEFFARHCLEPIGLFLD